MSDKETTRSLITLQDNATYPLDQFLIPHHYIDTLESILIPHGLILDRIEKLAQDIRTSYGETTIHLLCVLKGGASFFSDLIRKLQDFHQYNACNYVPFTFDFIKVKSYDGTSSSGHVEISTPGTDLMKLKDKHVLLVEDIIDTGLTMSKLVPMLQQYEPASVQVASLLEKRNPKSCGFQAKFVGFSIPDVFVVGYCLDFNEIYRDLSHICVINTQGIMKYKNQE